MIAPHIEAGFTPARVQTLMSSSDPAELIEAYGKAAPINADLARLIASFAGVLGEECKATQARCDYDCRHSHESSHDEIWAERDVATSRLTALQAVPEFKAAIDMVPEDDKAAIWDQYGPYEDDSEEDE